MKKLYGSKGEYLGSITEDSINVRAYDNTGKPVSTYNKTSNQTYNANGTRITFGNTVVSKLIK
jgi:IMP cyclohydrolase